MRYLKRQHPAAAKALKFPLSCSVLQQMFNRVPGFPRLQAMSHDDRAFVAASVIAVTCFLRGGEFCSYPGSARAALRGDNVEIITDESGTEYVQVRIVSPKNMFWLQSCTVRCFVGSEPGAQRAEDGLQCNDAVRALREYRARSPVGLLTADGPAFVLSNGRALSRDFMVKRSAQLLKAAGITFVDQAGTVAQVRLASWRSGGVRSALDAHIPVSTIMALGRWRSLAWENYTVLTTFDIRTAMAAMWKLPVSAPVGVLVPADVFAEEVPDTEGRR
jgi:hypothetical protein